MKAETHPAAAPDAVDAVDSIAFARDQFLARIAVERNPDKVVEMARAVVTLTQAMEIVSEEAVEQMDAAGWLGDAAQRAPH